VICERVGAVLHDQLGQPSGGLAAREGSPG
jgi:hypothetical protein